MEIRSCVPSDPFSCPARTFSSSTRNVNPRRLLRAPFALARSAPAAADIPTTRAKPIGWVLPRQLAPSGAAWPQLDAGQTAGPVPGRAHAVAGNASCVSL